MFIMSDKRNVQQAHKRTPGEKLRFTGTNNNRNHNLGAYQVLSTVLFRYYFMYFLK